MAIVDHEAFNNNWPCSSQLSSEDVSMSAILDQGSISFGRYCTESLAWEKWSVFPHNRCQEELAKFKSDGFVAKKKAYFDEYYRKVRAMKALQMDKQDSNQSIPGPCAQSNSVQVVNGINSDISEEDKKPSRATQNQICDYVSIADVDKSKQVFERAESRCCIVDYKVNMKDESSNIPFSEEAEESKSAFPDDIPTINTNFKAMSDNCDTFDVKHNIDRAPVAKKHGPVPKAQVNSIKKPERAKSFVHGANIEKRVVASRNILKCKNNVKANNVTVTSHRQPPEVSSSHIVGYDLMKRGRMKSNSPIIQHGPERAKSSMPRRMTGHIEKSVDASRRTLEPENNTKSNYATVTSHRQPPKVSSSPTLRCDSMKRVKMKPHSSIIQHGPESLECKSSSRLTACERSLQHTSKVLNADARRKPTLFNRLANTQVKSNKNNEVELAGKRHGMKGKQKEQNAKFGGEAKRDSKPVSTTLSTLHKTPTPKLMQKVAPLPSTKTMIDRRQPRQKIPIWR